MPLTLPILDDRTYQDLLDEALARIPVHTPEWTNFNKSDPGMTLIEVFAFLTENLFFRSNQIPERNRRKFLSLLGVPLQPAASAHGLVAFTNVRPGVQTITLGRGVEVRAGEVPYRTEYGLDVLPIEAQAFYKKQVDATRATELKPYYQALYSDLTGDVMLYESAPFPTAERTSIDLAAQDTIDRSLWVALLARDPDKQDLEAVRREIAGKTITLGIVPDLGASGRTLEPGAPSRSAGKPLLVYEIPVGGKLPADSTQRVARYRPLDAVAPLDVLAQPGIVQVTLPANASDLRLWDLEPKEAGVKDFPPALDDTKQEARVITWLRIRAAAVATRAPLAWAGINAAPVLQRAHVAAELVGTGNGEPDQRFNLLKTPVIPDSVVLRVTRKIGDRDETEVWSEIDDLTSAGPEVPVVDPRQPPATAAWRNTDVKVFSVDPESGEIRFGDGLRGARPPAGSTLRADYDYGVGRDGNVNAKTINTGPELPPGVKVENPIATWGGADAETVAEGEKQIARYLQHRDRLVTAEDFGTIVRRTPGVDIGRVDVIAAYNPQLDTNQPGDTPGAVTVLVLPKYDAANPDAPMPNQPFIDTVCDYVDARRLITTEVFIRGPVYKPLWISAGITVKAGYAIAEVRDDVQRAFRNFLSPLPRAASDALDHAGSPFADAHNGWPLFKAVNTRELLAVASRVKGVVSVDALLLGGDANAEVEQIDVRGLELPQLAGVAVEVGSAPLPLDALRGQRPSADAPASVPVPIVPEEC